jgi:hypothetical protein
MQCKSMSSCVCVSRVFLILHMPCLKLIPLTCEVKQFWPQNCLEPDLSGGFQTELVWPIPDLSGTMQFCFQNYLTSRIFVPSCLFYCD